MGLTAEHFKLAGQELSVFLTCFLNYVIDMGTVSVVLKEGILTPIFKKGDPSNPGRNSLTLSTLDKASGRVECSLLVIYKRYNNPLLLQLEKGYSGIKIGSISIPHVTVADDLVILAGSKSENQVMVWDVEDSSNRERYCVHPAKSHILWYKFGKKDNSDLDVWSCISGGYKGGSMFQFRPHT